MERPVRTRKKVNYKFLHEGEQIEEHRLCRPKTPVLKDLYEVERIIFRNRNEDEYLVKWLGNDLSECTWEPASHIPQIVIDNYIPKQILGHRVDEFSRTLERAFQSRLRVGNPKFTIFVDLDVYRYFFGDESSRTSVKEDFQNLRLSPNWYYVLHKDGTGRKVKFPVKLSVRVCMRDIYVKVGKELVTRRIPVERCTVFSCTESCDVSNLE